MIEYIKPLVEWPDPPLPEAYNGCRCSCHRLPNVTHFFPCCGPPINICDKCARAYDSSENKKCSYCDDSIIDKNKLRNDRIAAMERNKKRNGKFINEEKERKAGLSSAYTGYINERGNMVCKL